jgi:hypothetical protein
LYASRERRTALAETAYYRFVFRDGMREAPPSGRFVTQHAAVGAAYRSLRGLRLQEPPCADYTAQLSDPADYSAAQAFGGALREAQIDAIEFVSARDVQHGLNVALFAPDALSVRRPLWLEAWLCETRAHQVVFSGPGDRDLYVFPVEQFLVGGRLPQPAV